MCDPTGGLATTLLLSGGLAGGALTGAGMLADRSAGKAAARRQQQLSNQATQMQAAEFDRRMGYVRGSDTRTDALLTRQYGDTAGLEDSTFGYMLGQNQAGFDEQAGIAARAFDEQMTATGGLMTAQREARLRQRATSEAERNKQLAFQGESDTLAAALPGAIGSDAQSAGRATALAGRNGGVLDAITGATGPQIRVGGGDVIDRAFGRQAQRGMGEALTDAGGANNIAAYGDAFAGSERKLGDFATAIDALTAKAALSRAPLAEQLAVDDLSREQAQQRYDFATGLSSSTAGQEASAADARRTGLVNARSAYAGKFGDMLSTFFGNSLGSEQSYTGNMVGSSSNYENKQTNLANYKISNTTGYSPLGDILRLASTAAGGFSPGTPAKLSQKVGTKG